MFCPVANFTLENLLDEVFFLIRELGQSYNEIMSWPRDIRNGLLERQLKRIEQQREAARKLQD